MWRLNALIALLWLPFTIFFIVAGDALPAAIFGCAVGISAATAFSLRSEARA